MCQNSYAQEHFFKIADHGVDIIFNPSQINGIHLVPSLEPFRKERLEEPPLFSLRIDDSLAPCPKEQRRRIRVFDTGNGETIVDKLSNGGYQYIIKDIGRRSCCLLITNEDFSRCRCALNGTYNMRSFGLNNALMLIYAFAGSKKKTLLVHASLVRQNGYGYAFIAKSGTGKSTQVSMWLRHLPGCDLMNDDNPIIRIENGTPYIYGSPWSGKTPCYRNVKAPLGAVTRIERATANSIDQAKPIEAFASLLPSCSSMKWDTNIYNEICDVITCLVETTPVYTLHCLPDKEAAILCNKTITHR